MRMRLLAGLLAIFGTLPMLSAEDKPDHPLKTAKLGEWVEYKLTAQGLPQALTIRHTVSDKTDTALTVRIDISMGSAKQPTKVKTFSLTEPYDPLRMLQDEVGPFRGEIKMGNTGAETLKLNNKQYTTKWSEAVMTGEVMGKTVITKLKVWQSKEVPLSGMVRMDLKMDNMGALSEINMDLVGTGIDKIETKKK